MKKLNIIFSLLLLLIHLNLSSQASEQNRKTDVNWIAFWNGSLLLESDNLNRSKLTINGFGAKMQKVYNSGLGIELKSSFRSWNDFDRTVIPLTIGPSYTISSSNKMRFIIRTGVGPELILGNDYASIFAGFDIGPEIHMNIGNRHALVFGLTFAQAMSFHSGSFEYLDFYLGWRF